jgi:hypothetical protein
MNIEIVNDGLPELGFKAPHSFITVPEDSLWIPSLGVKAPLIS